MGRFIRPYACIVLVSGLLSNSPGRADEASLLELANRVQTSGASGEETPFEEDLLETLGFERESSAIAFSEIVATIESDTRIISVRNRGIETDVVVWILTASGWTAYVSDGDGELARAIQVPNGAGASEIPLAKARPQFEREIRFWKRCLLTEATVAIEEPWVGEWKGSDGVYTAEMSLTIDANSDLSGQIVWTLTATQREDYQDKIGLTGIEYVRGSFDPDSRLVRLEGYEMDDEHSILGLDLYELVLAPNARTLGGITRNHGTWKGQFHLVRQITP